MKDDLLTILVSFLPLYAADNNSVKFLFTRAIITLLCFVVKLSVDEPYNHLCWTLAIYKIFFLILAKNTPIGT